MKKIYSLILMCVCIISICGVAYAKDKEVTELEASATQSSVSVSGTTDAIAVIVQVRDSEGNILAMKSFGTVDGEFSGSITGLRLSSGTEYTICVADYDGGSWKKETVTCTAGSQGGIGNGSNETTEAATEPEEETTVNVEEVTFENDSKESENSCATKLEETSEELAKKIPLTQEEKQRVAKGENVKIYLDVKDAAASVAPEDKALIENAKGKAVVGIYLDINLFKRIGNDTPQKVTETNGAVAISLSLPTELINADSKVTRTYNIIRVHNGVTTILDCKYDAATNTLSFETDEFSIYALVYTDTVNKAGDTGDKSVPAFWFMLVVLSGAGALYIGKKSKKVTE